MNSVFQYIGAALFNNLIFFAYLYLVWLFCIIFFKKYIKPSMAFLLLFLLIAVGFVQFIVSLFSANFGIVKISYTIQRNSQAYDIAATVVGVFALCVSLRKVIIFCFKNSYNNHESLRPINNAALQHYMQVLCNYIGINNVAIYTSNTTIAYTKGLFKKVIVLPIEFIHQLTNVEVESILLHEVAHIKRYDHFTNPIIVVLDVALSANPLAQFLIKQLKLQRELACDDWVMAQQIQPKQYAQALYKAAAFATNKAMPHFNVAFYTPKKLLLFRVQRLFQGNSLHHSGKKMATLLAIVVSCLGFCNFKNTNGFAITNWAKQKASVGHNNSPSTTTSLSIKRPDKIKQTIKETAIITNNSSPITAVYKETPLILVANKNEEAYNVITVNSMTKRVDNTIFNIVDSVVIYKEEFGVSQLNELTAKPLANALNTIATLSNTNLENDLGIFADAIPLQVTQQGMPNGLFANTTMEQIGWYNNENKTWHLAYTLTNGATIAKKVITIAIRQKLQSISL